MSASAPSGGGSRPLLDLLSPGYNDQVSPDAPSIFELMASDELKGLIQPAFRYVLAFVAQRYPRYLLRFINRHEESYALLMLLVEGYHLRAHDSTFADHFYGLKLQSDVRSAAAALKPTSDLEQLRSETIKGKHRAQAVKGGLTDRQRALYLLCTVGIPYARSKLQDLYERMGGGVDPTLEVEEAEGGSTRDHFGRIRMPASRLQRFLFVAFKRLYPYLNLTWELYILSHDIAYMFGRTRWWRPWHRWLGIITVRRGEELPLPSTASLANNRRPFLFRLLANHLPAVLRKLAHNILPITLLSLKFLQWWYSPQSPRATARSVEQKTRVPSPSMLYPLQKGNTLVNASKASREHTQPKDGEQAASVDEASEKKSWTDTSPSAAEPASQLVDATGGEESRHGAPYKPISYGLCPLCGEGWRNPTLTPTGYVGCFVCLHEAVEREHKCPVTGASMVVEQLRRVVV